MMRKLSQILFITLLISMLGFTYSAMGYIPEDELVFDQVAFDREVVVEKLEKLGFNKFKMIFT